MFPLLFCLDALLQPAAEATAPAKTFAELQSLSYKEVKGSGLASTCPALEDSASSNPKVGAGQGRLITTALSPADLPFYHLHPLCAGLACGHETSVALLHRAHTH